MAAGPNYDIQDTIMLSANGSGFTPSTLFLMGIPGLEAYHIWFAAPLSAIYIVTLLGNCTLLMAVKYVLSLHKPMYFFISQLALADVAGSTCIFPKILAILFFNAGEISLNACLVQMFIVHCFQALESSLFSAMAFDRYVAVCYPLRYTTILTNSLIAKIMGACLARAVVLVVPLPLLRLRLPFCSRYIAHLYCEHLTVAKLSCSDITVNSIYALALSLLAVSVDIVCIALSYILILRTILRLPLQERYKAFSTCSSHICVITAFYTPVFFTVVLHRLPHSIPLYVDVLLSITYLILPPFINPLIFGLLLKEVQKGVQQMFLKTKVTLWTHGRVGQHCRKSVWVARH